MYDRFFFNHLKGRNCCQIRMEITKCCIILGPCYDEGLYTSGVGTTIYASPEQLEGSYYTSKVVLIVLIKLPLVKSIYCLQLFSFIGM